MIEPELSPNEPIRLKALHETRQLDTPFEERFDRITQLAQRQLKMPIAAISLVDADRQWFKSVQGLDANETSRAVSFCGHAILGNEVFVVNDARLDKRFLDNPLVAGDPKIVFYAGCPIQAYDGSNIATLCVVDHVPRELSLEDLQSLSDLAALAGAELMKTSPHGEREMLLDQIDLIMRVSQVDPVTRAWDRESILDIARNQLEAAARNGGAAGLLLVRMAANENVRSTAARDSALRHFGKCLLGAIQPFDSLGRYEDDQFLIVAAECANLDEAMGRAQRALGCLGERPWIQGDASIVLSGSCGIAFAAAAVDATADKIIALAAEALAAATAKGSGQIEARVAPALAGQAAVSRRT